MDTYPNVLLQQVKMQPFPLLFTTISGAHLYGFPSADSDYDLRAVHVLPAEQVLGLQEGPETIERSGIFDGIEVDLVSHDARKFFLLLLKKNGYVLEQLYSPLIVQTTAEHGELKEIAIAASPSITRIIILDSPRRSGSCLRRNHPAG